MHRTPVVGSGDRAHVVRRWAVVFAVLIGDLCAPAAQTPDVSLDGKVDTRVETGYLSSSGTLIDTRPSLEHQLDLTLHLAEYGRLTACGWVISALHGGRDRDHRRALYLYESTVGYGYDVTISESLDFCNEAGIVWDSPWGYKDYSQEEVAWWYRNSLENPLIVPYTETIGLFSPDRWVRVALGLRRAFKVCDSVSVMPFVETVWGNSDRYCAQYGETPSHRFLGGAFMTMTPGVRIDWNFFGNWIVWFRFREFVTVDPQARTVVSRQTEYYQQNEAEIFSLGLSYCF